MKNTVHKRVNFFKKQAPWAVLAAIMFMLGHEFAYHRQQQQDDRVSMLAQSNENLTNENSDLTATLNQQKIQLDVKELRIESAQQLLSESLERETELKQQIGFYQRVMAPETSADGFLVEHAEVSNLQEINAFRLSLVLLQNQSIKDTIEGKLAIRLIGTKEGDFVSYQLEEISEQKKAFKYAFKYFQVKEISFVIPENFTPERFEISTDVYKYKRKRASYFRSINWSDVMTDTENT